MTEIKKLSSNLSLSILDLINVCDADIGNKSTQLIKQRLKLLYNTIQDYPPDLVEFICNPEEMRAYQYKLSNAQKENKALQHDLMNQNKRLKRAKKGRNNWKNKYKKLRRNSCAQSLA